MLAAGLMCIVIANMWRSFTWCLQWYSPNPCSRWARERTSVYSCQVKAATSKFYFTFVAHKTTQCTQSICIEIWQIIPRDTCSSYKTIEGPRTRARRCGLKIFLFVFFQYHYDKLVCSSCHVLADSGPCNSAWPLLPDAGDLECDLGSTTYSFPEMP